MVDIIKNNLDKIVEACREYRLASLYLIGSAARETDFTKDSDIDFLYKTMKNSKGMSLNEFDYFDFLWKLEAITGKKVDLVAEEGIRNRFFRKSIEEDKVKLYEA